MARVYAQAASAQRQGVVVKTMGPEHRDGVAPLDAQRITGDFDPPGDGTLQDRADAMVADQADMGSYVGHGTGDPRRTYFDSSPAGWRGLPQARVPDRPATPPTLVGSAPGYRPQNEMGARPVPATVRSGARVPRG